MSSKGTQEGEEYLPSSSHSLKGGQDVKKHGLLAQGFFDVKGVTSVSPDSCIFPHIETAKFLQLGILAFLK